MLPRLFIAFGMQAQITEADVPLIVESIAEHVTSHTVAFNDQSLEGRHVFIAGEKARAAFGKVAPSVQPMEFGAEESYTVVPEDEAPASCPAPPFLAPPRQRSARALSVTTSRRHCSTSTGRMRRSTRVSVSTCRSRLSIGLRALAKDYVSRFDFEEATSADFEARTAHNVVLSLGPKVGF